MARWMLAALAPRRCPSFESALLVSALWLSACGSDSSPSHTVVKPAPDSGTKTHDAGNDVRDGAAAHDAATLDAETEDAGSDAGSSDTLDGVGVFSDPIAQIPNAGVVPYDVVVTLYADQAEKLRFLTLPTGTQATYDPLEQWTYPDGTKFIKTFFYSHDQRNPSLGRTLLETRIVEREAGTWTGRTYVWNAAQTQATRVKVGASIPVSWIDPSGKSETLDYRVPNEIECKTCHAKDHVFQPLGPRTRELNRDASDVVVGDAGKENQIDHLVALGLLGGTVPAVADRLTLSFIDGPDALDRRARSYLDANCSHCHRPGGEAGSTALDLRFETTSMSSIGICRTPVAAGPGSGNLQYDIVPGSPDASVMVFRISSTDPELKMPQLPTQTADAQGVALIRAWIAAMPAQTCN